MGKVKPTVSPSDPIELQPAIGLIGMGMMGTLYAKHFAAAGWKKIYVCDVPNKFEALKETYKDNASITVLKDGHAVSRTSDWIMYSVEAEFIEKVVKEFGPSTKVGAVVAGQTSVKTPEQAAFDKYLPEDVHIVSCHSLHGPTVNPIGQPLVIIRHRASDDAFALSENILKVIGSRFVYMSYEEHDRITANTQAVTHAAFLSMGTAWASEGTYPWEHGYYVKGIETVKVNIMLRIYSNKFHVYAGLAILNPSARVQIDQYAKSAADIYKLMLKCDGDGLRSRIYQARDLVFGGRDSENRTPIFLSEDLLDRFSLGKLPGDASPPLTPPGKHRPPPNSHLSLLAMVDCWAHLGIHPFVHLDLAATPLFRMWIGVAECLFRSQERLDAAIHAALFDLSHRSDDLEFVIAAKGWSQCISFGSFELYKNRFEQTAAFFKPRFEDANELGAAMIQAIMESATQ